MPMNLDKSALKEAVEAGSAIHAAAKNNNYAVVFVGWSGCGTTQTHTVARTVGNSLGVPVWAVNYEKSLGIPNPNGGTYKLPADLKGTYDKEVSGTPDQYGLSGPVRYVTLVNTTTGNVVGPAMSISDPSKIISTFQQKINSKASFTPMIPQKEVGRFA
jgi:hypothetical protein